MSKFMLNSTKIDWQKQTRTEGRPSGNFQKGKEQTHLLMTKRKQHHLSEVLTTTMVMKSIGPYNKNTKNTNSGPKDNRRPKYTANNRRGTKLKCSLIEMPQRRDPRLSDCVFAMNESRWFWVVVGCGTKGMESGKSSQIQILIYAVFRLWRGWEGWFLEKE